MAEVEKFESLVDRLEKVAPKLQQIIKSRAEGGMDETTVKRVEAAFTKLAAILPVLAKLGVKVENLSLA